MKQGREDQRRVTLRYLHDGESGVTTLVIDVEVPEDEMPHEHRQELREMAEELLGVPLGSLPEGVKVNLKRPSEHGRAHDHEHDHEHEAGESEREAEGSGRQALKAGA